MSIEAIITELCTLPGPAGFEEHVASRVRELLEPLTDEVRTDILGNIIGVRRCRDAAGCVRKNAKKLLFDAHIDEIGLIITGHEEGFLRFSTLGGVDGPDAASRRDQNPHGTADHRHRRRRATPCPEG